MVNFVNAGIITYPDIDLTEVNGSSDRRAGIGYWSWIEEFVHWEPTAIQTYQSDIEQEKERLKGLTTEEYVNLVWDNSTPRARKLMKHTDAALREYIATSNRELAGNYIPFGEEYRSASDDEISHEMDREEENQEPYVVARRYSLVPGTNEHRRVKAQEHLELCSPWAYGKCGLTPSITSAADIERIIDNFAANNDNQLKFSGNYPESIRNYAASYANVLHLDAIKKNYRGYQEVELIIFKNADEPQIADLLRVSYPWRQAFNETYRQKDDYRNDGKWGSRTPSPEPDTSGW